ncbi:MAG: flagellar biosynthesis protein FlhB [SAR324 cluster bacterium]|nr:flagellar biosynthesis protein FlhB [SAR324 cluster bacterium]
MAEDNFQEKTEAPTARKREELRTEGRVAYSREIPGALVLATTVLIFVFGGYIFLDRALLMLTRALSNIELGEFTLNSVANYLAFNVMDFGSSIFLLFGAIFVIGILGGIVQIGFRMTLMPIMPKLQKINPLSGFGRIFSLNNLGESVKIIIKLSIISYVIYSVLVNDVSMIARYQNMEQGHFLYEFWALLSEMLLKLSLAFAVLAGFDYFWQRFNFERQIKMTKQEYKEEQQQAEGNPLVRARIRRIQQKMSQARMLQEVPTSDVVITNPTHYAIVLKYDAEVMSAPQLVAKGIDYLALRIIEIAKKSNVIVTRNPAVARGVYAAVETGDYIPEEFYQVIAEIIATAYKSKGIAPPAN